MNTFRHDDEQRWQWVRDKFSKQKTVKQICREAQISRATLYNWIDEYKSENPLKEIDDQNAGTDPVQDHVPPATLPVHHAATKHRMLLAALDKVDVDKAFARKLVGTLIKRFTLSIAQACEITGIDEATYGYKPRKPEVDDRLVQQAIVQLLTDDPARSFDQCCDLLCKTNPGWTRKQIKRVYREGRLYLKRQRSRSGKKGATLLPVFPLYPQRPDACWNLGMLQGKNDDLLYILDDADAVLLNTEKITGRLTTENVTAFLNRAILENGRPRRLRVPDKEPFNIREITGWAHQHKLSLLRLSMGKPENELEMQGMEKTVREQVGLPVET